MYIYKQYTDEEVYDVLDEEEAAQELASYYDDTALALEEIAKGHSIQTPYACYANSFALLPVQSRP